MRSEVRDEAQEAGIDTGLSRAIRAVVSNRFKQEIWVGDRLTGEGAVHHARKMFLADVQQDLEDWRIEFNVTDLEKIAKGVQGVERAGQVQFWWKDAKPEGIFREFKGGLGADELSVVAQMSSNSGTMQVEGRNSPEDARAPLEERMNQWIEIFVRRSVHGHRGNDETIRKIRERVRQALDFRIEEMGMGSGVYQAIRFIKEGPIDLDRLARSEMREPVPDNAQHVTDYRPETADGSNTTIGVVTKPSLSGGDKDHRPQTTVAQPAAQATALTVDRSALPAVESKPSQILWLQQEVIAVVEQAQIDALSPEMYKELLEIAAVNNAKLHLVIPDALEGQYSKRRSELRKVASVHFGFTDIAHLGEIPVVGFSDMDRDTLDAFKKRLDPRIAERMKNSAFGLNHAGAFGVGILYALKDIPADQLSPNQNGFLYDASGRWSAQVFEALQAYTVISIAA
jgi:hypothetical protein